MPLTSEYLSNEEWMMVLYLHLGGPLATTGSFAESIRLSHALLSARGYTFRGLDQFGNPQVLQGPRVRGWTLALLGDPDTPPISDAGWVQFLTLGRRSVKRVAPDLVTETDEEWHTQLLEFLEAAKSPTPRATAATIADGLHMTRVMEGKPTTRWTPPGCPHGLEYCDDQHL